MVEIFSAIHAETGLEPGFGFTVTHMDIAEPIHSVSFSSAATLLCKFQPIVSSGYGSSIYGHECLTRFLDDQGREFSVGQLFESDADHDLKRQWHSNVLKHCFRDASKQIGAGRLFVNVNPQFFYEDGLQWSEILGLAANSGVSPSQFVWEIVETDRVDDDRDLVRFAKGCRAMGSQVALDDWGSQVRSLDLLEKIRPDFVKLEKELVTSCFQNEFRSTMVSGILQLCRDLNIKTVAEGVETAGDWSWVRRNRADFGQGYFLGRPQATPARSIHGADILRGPHFGTTADSQTISAASNLRTLRGQAQFFEAKN